MNRYQNIPITKYENIGSQYYLNNIYPDIPVSNNDDYVITVLGDRLDLLAYDFYSDETLWWIIATANGLSGDSLYLEPGIQLRIPVDVTSIINNYKLTNITR